MVLFLASEKASFMTGEHVNVDGGYMALGAWANPPGSVGKLRTVGASAAEGYSSAPRVCFSLSNQPPSRLEPLGAVPPNVSARRVSS